jgi:hypothetical protein
VNPVEVGGTFPFASGGNPEPSFFGTSQKAALPSGGRQGREKEGVETWRPGPKEKLQGQGKVQATNRKGSESYRSKKIRWGVSPVRVRVPPPAVRAKWLRRGLRLRRRLVNHDRFFAFRNRGLWIKSCIVSTGTAVYALRLGQVNTAVGKVELEFRFLT